MTMTRAAYFLWVGGTLPDMARISVLSAAEAGFETVLFTDRSQELAHANLRLSDWREIALPWAPDEVRLKGEDRPCYAAFSDLFRFALLAKNDGWWFDCDTIILRDASDFASLLHDGKLTVGRENDQVINGAVLGSVGKTHAQHLYDRASEAFPVLDAWGVVGPALITRAISEGAVAAQVLDQDYFYPVHHADIAEIYLPEKRVDLIKREKDWYCLSVWGEVLSRSGLAHLQPPLDSYLGDLLVRRPALGEIGGDSARMADYLAENLRLLDDRESGRTALKTLVRKARARLSWGRTSGG
jgi:hypothetical protein